MVWNSGLLISLSLVDSWGNTCPFFFFLCLLSLWHILVVVLLSFASLKLVAPQVASVAASKCEKRSFPSPPETMTLCAFVSFLGCFCYFLLAVIFAGPLKLWDLFCRCPYKSHALSQFPVMWSIGRIHFPWLFSLVIFLAPANVRISPSKTFEPHATNMELELEQQTNKRCNMFLLYYRIVVNENLYRNTDI